MRPRLLLADDHTLLLDGIRLMLAPEYELIGSVEDGHSLLAAARDLKPDVILLDISMPLLNGIDAAHQLRRIVPSSKLIFVTMHADPDFVTEAFRAGASGYVLKRAAASELMTAVREVLKGNQFVSPLVTRNTLELLIASARPASKLADRLTTRQREVLQLVAEGKNMKQIAHLLGISSKTAEAHRSQLMDRLDIHDVAGLVRYAIRTGLISAEK